MKGRVAPRLAWAPLVFFPAIAIVGLVLAAASGKEGDLLENLAFTLIFLAFATVGALIASRHPENVIGWMFTGIAGGAAIAFVAGAYAIYAVVGDSSVPGQAWAAWVTGWAWIAFIGPLFTHLPLLFPDGRLPSGRWRPFAWTLNAYFLFAVTIFALAPDVEVIDGRFIENPLPVSVPAGLVDAVEGPGLFGFLVFGLGSALSLFLRYRRSRSEERHQIKWFVYAVTSVAAFFVLTVVLEAVGGSELSDNWVTTVLAVLAFGSVPVTAGIGILKHRLYDIDVVINKTVVLGALAVFITAVYVAIVVGIGAAVGSRSNLGLSILATAIIAVAFQPVRERARHLANRLVYGERATPYEVLSEFSERMAGTYASEDILPRMARILAEGTGAGRAEVWLRVGDEIRLAASWPPSEEEAPKSSPPMSLVDGALPPFPAGSSAAPVAHQGELLGALVVTKPPAEPLTATEEKLATDLASQAGLVLRNVRLTTELMARLEDLRASRKRLVTAQDEERRRLERNIHDGAQQQLVSLAVKLRILEALVPRDPEQALAVVRELQAEANAALDDLRDLARGIYPPLLADRGLVPALEAQARKAVGHVRVQATGGSPVGAPDGAVGRYPQEVEAAVYFCVLEALQNVTKYARATEAVVSLEAADGEVTFTVADDGVGFDPKAAVGGSGLRNMADRVAALGGTLDVRSVPGRGTTVTGSIPIG